MSRLYDFMTIVAVVLAIAFFVFAPPRAHASLTNPEAVNFSTSVSTASAQILPADPLRRYLLIQNPCTVNIGVNPTAGTAAIGSAGTFTLFPGGSWEFKDRDVPQNAMTAIAASGTCAVSIMEIR